MKFEDLQEEVDELKRVLDEDGYKRVSDTTVKLDIKTANIIDFGIKELKEKLDYAVKQKIYYMEEVDELRRENKELILKMIPLLRKLKV